MLFSINHIPIYFYIYYNSYDNLRSQGFTGLKRKSMKKSLGEPTKNDYKIRTRQAQLIGHTMRKKNLERLVTTGKIEVKRPRECL